MMNILNYVGPVQKLHISEAALWKFAMQIYHFMLESIRYDKETSDIIGLRNVQYSLKAVYCRINILFCKIFYSTYTIT